MTCEEARAVARQELYRGLRDFIAGEDDAESFTSHVEKVLRDLSRVEGRDGVLSPTELTDLSCLTREVFEAQYHMGNAELTVSKMMFALGGPDV